MKRNAFKQKIPEIRELMDNTEINKYIRNTLTNVLKTLEIANAENIVNSIIDLATKYENIKEYETEAHKLLESYGVTDKRIGEKLVGRSDLIYSQIKDYVKKGSVLDLGCGDGKVGEKLSKGGLEVTLTDVYKHSHVDETGLDFIEFKQGEKVPQETAKYSNVLLLTVMHHSDDPIQSLSEAKRVAKKGGRIIAIESVYGINSSAENAEPFAKLDSEQQRLANIFFDHFYNRIVHYSEDPSKKVNVPFNFNTPEGWNREAEKLGLREIATKHLGIDQPIVPEYHTIHVWEVK